jgi:hypothetical protein
MLRHVGLVGLVQVLPAHKAGQARHRLPQPAIEDVEEDEPQHQRLDDRVDQDQREAIRHLANHHMAAGIHGPGTDVVRHAVFITIQDREAVAGGGIEEARLDRAARALRLDVDLPAT